MWLSASDGREGIGFGRSEPMKEQRRKNEKRKWKGRWRAGPVIWQRQSLVVSTEFCKELRAAEADWMEGTTWTGLHRDRGTRTVVDAILVPVWSTLPGYYQDINHQYLHSLQFSPKSKRITLVLRLFRWRAMSCKCGKNSFHWNSSSREPKSLLAIGEEFFTCFHYQFFIALFRFCSFLRVMETQLLIVKPNTLEINYEPNIPFQTPPSKILITAVEGQICPYRENGHLHLRQSVNMRWR